MASATSSDWYDNSTFTNDTWTWVNTPTHSYNIDSTVANGLYVNTTNAYNPDETTNLALSGMTYKRQSLTDSEYNVSLYFDSLDFLPNTAVTALILENDSNNYLAIVVKKNAGNRYIRFNTIQSGIRTQNELSGAILQSVTGDLEIKFQVYDDAGTTKINTFYVLDDGTEVQQGNAYTSPWSSFNYVGQVFGSDDAVGGDIYIYDFIWNDETAPVYEYSNIELTDGTPGIIDLNDVNIEISDLYDHIVSEKGNTTTESDYIEKVDSATYHIKARLLSDSTGSLIADSKDMRFSRELTAGHDAIMATVNFTDSTVRCWNSTSDSETPFGYRAWYFKSNTTLNNVTFDTFRKISFGDSTNGGVSDVSLTDVYMTNWYQYVVMYGDNFTVDGFQMIDSNTTWLAGQAGIDYSLLNNSTLSNIIIDQFATTEKPTHDSTYSYGIHMEGFGNDLSNITINNTVYSGLVYFGCNSTLTDIKLHDCEHNSIETRTGYNPVVDYNIWRDVTVTGGNGEEYYDSAMLITADVGNTMTGNEFHNMTFDHNGSGGSFKITGNAGGIYDSLFSNLSISTDPILIQGGVRNTTFVNLSLVDNKPEYSYSMAFSQEDGCIHNSNVSIIDMDSNKPLYIYDSANLIFANVYNIDSPLAVSNVSYTVMYPINAYVVNTTGYPVTYANITLNVTTFGLKGLGEYSISGVTDSTGKLNYSQRLYVPDYLYDGSYTYYTLNTVTADKDGESYTSAAFNPDSTWYSSNSSEPNGTLITLTLDVPGEGEAPAETPLSVISSSGSTLLSYGYPSTYNVTANKTASVYWQVDGSTEETDADTTEASFEWNPTSSGDFVISANVTDGSTWDNSTTWNVNVWGHTAGTYYQGTAVTLSWVDGAWVESYGSGYPTRNSTVITGVEVRP